MRAGSAFIEQQVQAQTHTSVAVTTPSLLETEVGNDALEGGEAPSLCKLCKNGAQPQANRPGVRHAAVQTDGSTPLCALQKAAASVQPASCTAAACSLETDKGDSLPADGTTHFLCSAFDSAVDELYARETSVLHGIWTHSTAASAKQHQSNTLSQPQGSPKEDGCPVGHPASRGRPDLFPVLPAEPCSCARELGEEKAEVVGTFVSASCVHERYTVRCSANVVGTFVPASHVTNATAECSLGGLPEIVGTFIPASRVREETALHGCEVDVVGTFVPASRVTNNTEESAAKGIGHSERLEGETLRVSADASHVEGGPQHAHVEGVSHAHTPCVSFEEVKRDQTESACTLIAQAGKSSSSVVSASSAISFPSDSSLNTEPSLAAYFGYARRSASSASSSSALPSLSSRSSTSLLATHSLSTLASAPDVVPPTATEAAVVQGPRGVSSLQEGERGTTILVCGDQDETCERKCRAPQAGSEERSALEKLRRSMGSRPSSCTAGPSVDPTHSEEGAVLASEGSAASEGPVNDREAGAPGKAAEAATADAACEGTQPPAMGAGDTQAIPLATRRQADKRKRAGDEAAAEEKNTGLAKRKKKLPVPVVVLSDADMFDSAALPSSADSVLTSAQRELLIQRCVVQASGGITHCELPRGGDRRIVRWQLSDTATLHVVFNVITQQEASDAFAYLKSEWGHWERGEYKMYGKAVKTPRLLSACSAESPENLRKYKVTGCHTEPPVLGPVTERVGKLCRRHFVYAQMNYYQTGDDYIGMHRDREVVRGEYVAGLSLGAPRKIVFQAIDNKAKKLTLLLPDRSICLMSGDIQETWKHGIPKMPKVTEPRISLTYREE